MTTDCKRKINHDMVHRYLGDLVNRFYKILPIKENGEPTLKQYMESLLREMIGFECLISSFKEDSRFLTLLSILEYMITHEDDDVSSVKSDVFKAINLLKKMQAQYASEMHLEIREDNHSDRKG